MIGLFLPVIGILLMVTVPVALILWIVRVLRHQETTLLTVEQVRHGLIGTAVAVVAAVFLVLLTNQLAPDYPANFAVGLTLATLTFVAGLATRQLPTVGTSLIVAALAMISFAFGVHGHAFDAGTKLVVSLAGLTLTSAITYRAGVLDQLTPNRLRLTKVRAGLVGITIVGLALLATGFGTALTGYVPGDAMDGVASDNSAAGLTVTLLLGTVWLAVGSFARRIPALSVGFLVAGGLAFLTSLSFIVTTIKGIGPVLVTGLVLVGLITLAYRSLRE